MYSDVKGLSVTRGIGAGALPVTGALMLGWSVVAAVVLLSVGVALLSISRVIVSRHRMADELS